MIITVTNSATLASALKTVHDGDTIQLASGEYTLSKLQNLNFTKGVTITSVDPSHEAVIDGLNMQNVSGLSFSNLEVKVDEVQGIAVNLNGGANDHFSNLDIHGSAVGDGKGVQIKSASNITLDHLNIHDVQGGAGLVDSTNVSFTNSSIHDIQIDGIQSLGTSNVTISGNSFTNFFPKAGDHSDAIQFVTATTTTPTHDVTITNNTYVRGAGAANTQGIFLGNEAKIDYQNVNISGNSIVGGIYQGIMVSGANNVQVTNNLVEGYTDINSWIYVNATTNATVSNNIATTFNLSVSNPGLVATGNTTIALGKIGDTSLLTDPGSAHAVATTPVVTTPVVTAPVVVAAPVPVVATPAAPSAPVAPASPVVVTHAATPDIVATITSTTTATGSAPSGSTGVVLDANSHVWINSLFGGAGGDTLNAGAGANYLTGGGGADHFVFSVKLGVAAEITDFAPGQDVIDVRGLLSSMGYTGVNPIADHSLTFLSDGAGGTKVMLDPDGAGPKAATYILHLDHVAPTAITASDWIFH